jgi:hypothetical protein
MTERYLRRKDAAKYLVETHNVACSKQTLAKLACVNSDGPPFRLAGRFPLYPVSGLDAWARSKIGPLVRSTSEVRELARLADKRVKLSPQDEDKRNLAKQIEPMLISVTADGSSAKELAEIIANRVLNFVYGVRPLDNGRTLTPNQAGS